MGNPISQARSPKIVNSILAAGGFRDFVMVPLHVPVAAFSDAISGPRGIENFRGSIVTMPHKEDVTSMVDELPAESRQVSACNVIRRERSGRLVGTMLDGEGFIAGLASRGHSVAGKRVFLAGAGGAASGIAFATGKYRAKSRAAP